MGYRCSLDRGGKVVLSLMKHHAMKPGGTEHIAAHIRNLGTGCREVVGFTLRLLYRRTATATCTILVEDALLKWQLERQGDKRIKINLYVIRTAIRIEGSRPQMGQNGV
jgi:hypothetical protein